MNIDEVKFFDYRRVFEEKEKLIIEKISEIMNSGIFINGKDVRIFEEKMSEYLDSTFLACSNGTDALTIAFLYIKNITKKNEVIVPSFTFVSSAMSPSKLGFEVKFVDTDLNRFCPSVDSVISLTSDDTAAIVWPHLFGYTEDLARLRDYCDDRGIFLIEDCAQSLGSVSKAGNRTGSLGHISTFSFFPVKNLGAFGDAGGLMLDSDDMTEDIRSIISHGYIEKYHPKLIGGNYRMDTIQAGILNVLFDTLPDQIAKRKSNANRYLSEIHNKDIILPVDTAGSAWNQFTIITEHRDALIRLLKKSNIDFQIYYPVGLHMTEVYYNNSFKSLPNTERLCNSVLSIPIYPGLTKGEIDYVIDILNSFEV